MDAKKLETPALAVEAVRLAQQPEQTVAIASRALEDTKRQMQRAKLLLDGQVTAIAPDVPERIELK